MGWILKGVHEGLDNLDFEPHGEVGINSHKFATSKLYKTAMKKQIMEEIKNGHNRVVNTKINLNVYMTVKKNNRAKLVCGKI